MQERRRLPRRKPQQMLKIFDRDSGRYLGQVGNISQEGIMLESLTPIRVGSALQLEIALEYPVDDVDKLSFRAVVVWSFQSKNQAGGYWSGFQITDIDPASADFIGRWIRDWEADGR